MSSHYSVSSRATLFGVCLAAMLITSTTHADTWPAPIEGFKAPVAGEHPRLLFRKADLPALKKKAQTPEGRAIIARLKYLLGGGEAMPTEFNPHPPLNIGPKGPSTLKPGAFTVNHAAGFGLLYQLTGDKKYADLAWQCLEKVFEGQVDRDERYSWKAPGTGFRISGVLQSVALAYDLNYDAWAPEQRKKVVNEIQNLNVSTVKGKRSYTLSTLASGGKYPPSSNHYGAYISGPGIAALAIKGDPGADDAKLNKIIATVEKSMKTLLTNAYGDSGWFGEGTGSDKTAMQPGTLGYFIAAKNVQGKDWTVGKPNGSMIMIIRALEMVNGIDSVDRPQRGLYAHGTDSYFGGSRDAFRDSGGWSADGLFSIGLGALPDKYKPGMKWIYENFVEPGVAPADRIYEARIDPLHAVYAFVNWPLQIKAENPEKAWPLIVHDSLHGYVLARSGFDAERGEVLFTGLSRTGPVGYHKTRAPQDVWVWFDDYRVSMGRFGRAGISNWQATNDAATFNNGTTAWAIDYTGHAGCEGVITMMGEKAGAGVRKIIRLPRVADDKIDLNGRWTDGVKIEHTGKELKATVSKGWKQATGTIDGRTITMNFGKKGNKLKGVVSPDGNKIDWSNGYSWARGTKQPRWKYAEGEKVKVTKVTVGGQNAVVVTFATDGKHPEVKADGDTITVGGQTIKLADGKLVLGKYEAGK